MKIIKEIRTRQIEPNVAALFSYVIADDKIAGEYKKYISYENRKLYGFCIDKIFAGLIGIEYSSSNKYEIKHIAVSPSHRRKKQQPT